MAVIDSEEEIKICVGTWNVGEAPPPLHDKFHGWLKPGCHVYVVGTQENTNYDWTPNLLALFNKQDYLKDDFDGDKYVVYKSANISYMKGRHKIILQLDVFGLASVFKHVNNLRTFSEATGAGGVIANKGGVMCSFNIRDVSFCFVTCHLAAHQNKQAHRNSNVREILAGTGTHISKDNTKVDADLAYDYVFWCGDLNYRVDFGEGDVGMTPSDELFAEVQQHIDDENYSLLLKGDQLTTEREAGRVFHGWQETEPAFKPTFKVKVGDSSFAYKTQRLPAWCDRVLWRCSCDRPIDQKDYDAAPLMSTSDHKPVYSIFEVPVFDSPPSRVSNFDIATLDIGNVSVKMLGSDNKIPSELSIIFFADFLASTVKASKKRTTECSDGSFTCQWNGDEFVKRLMNINNPARLEVCRLFVAIKTFGKLNEHKIGMCVLSLKGAAYGKEMKFEAELTHSGLVVGTITGTLNVTSKSVEGMPDDYESDEDEELGSLVAHVKNATNVPKMDITSESDPFITIHLNGVQVARTPTIEDNAHPNWNCTKDLGSIQNISVYDEIKIGLWDYDKIGNDLIGEITQPIIEFLNRRGKPWEIPVKKKKNGKPCMVYLMMSVQGKMPAEWRASVNTTEVKQEEEGPAA